MIYARTPEDAVNLIFIAVLVLTVGACACTLAAHRAGLSLREWWDSLR